MDPIVPNLMPSLPEPCTADFTYERLQTFVYIYVTWKYIYKLKNIHLNP